MKAVKLTTGFVVVTGVWLLWSQTTVLAGGVSECYGDGQQNAYVCDHTMTSDEYYRDLTIVASDCTFDTQGFRLYVSGTLTNYGTIEDNSGLIGGAGGQHGEGGHGFAPHISATPGGPGGDGQEPPGPGPGCSGPGGGGGGGGGGAWTTTPGCLVEGNVPGGDGGDGGDGGRGGGFVRIYAYNLDNQGVIHADGGDGADGQPGRMGSYNRWWCFIAWRDAAGGGGGGGGGGDGGDGGTVEIHYANLINLGVIRASGGAPGSGGSEGGSQCGQLQESAGLGQQWEYGAPDGPPGWDPCPPPGENGCGWGGGGGESDIGKHCGPTSPGFPGLDGCNGEDGLVTLLRDCNCNDVPDDEDISGGTSEDCQPNDIPDECDIESGASGDCNVNMIPDECDTAAGGQLNCVGGGPVSPTPVPRPLVPQPAEEAGPAEAAEPAGPE